MSTAPEDPGVFFKWMMHIENDDNENSETAGLRFRYDCSDVFADITLTTGELNTEEKPSSVVAEFLERYNKISTFWDDEPEPAAEDVEAVENEIKEFVHNLCSPVLRALVPPSSENYDPESLPENLECYMYPKSVNLQIINQTAIPALPSQKAELPSYSPSQSKVIETYRPWALKVSIFDKIMFCKLNGAIHDSFNREYQVLQKILDADDLGSIRVPKLKGTVQVTEGVVGILIDFIETDKPDLTFNLSDEGQISESLRSKWESQLAGTLSQLHAMEVVWGDAKTANVLADKNLDLWIVDFGGGQTMGWVANELVDTKEGDLHALEKIFKDVGGERSKESIVQGRTFRMDGAEAEPFEVEPLEAEPEAEPKDNEDGCKGSCDCHRPSKKQRCDLNG